ncbi:hypothetical protein C8A00DRAFT_18554 [Chaetomidium leptoderma]|uniref:Ubiquitin 3 binding protein But2 C-terminal domain-containing protein n=1 Tax=Chaetomidium leptoderma TaxID=669021 RepID=A0AAN6VGM3_9PEZI|nr:hypothetical protein C8A00DRAFT_18554 [Chaetomidium leptoderma]
MQYLTVTALLLPATVLANPIAVVRRAAPKAQFIGFSAQQGCGNNVSVAFDEANQVANVSLPEYSVRLPGPNRERGCSVTLTVRFPANVCTTGTAFGTASGQITLPDGVQAKFHARDYAVSPTPGQVSHNSPNGEWSGPINKRYTIDDTVSYTFRPDPNNRDVNFTLPGRLQLQPSNGPSGFLSNDRFVFDIRTQIPCCEFNTLLLRKSWF